jgi:hypothetical protein
VNALADLPLFQKPMREMSALEAAFWKFHEGNPHVYDLLVRLAREWKGQTGRQLGIKALFERARWEYSVRTTDSAPALNNNHTAFYARLIMERERDLQGIFHTREQRAVH